MTFGRNNATETTQKIVQEKKLLYFLHFWSNKGYFEGHFNPRKNTLYIIFLIYYYTGWVKKSVISVVFFIPNFFHEIFIFGIFAIFCNIVFICLKLTWYYKKNPHFPVKIESEEKQKCDSR